MFRTFKVLSSVILLLSISIIFSLYSYAETALPDNIRIGLYYNDNASGVYKAVSSFTVQSDSGMEAGFAANSAFTVLVKDTSKKILNIRKDAYFTKSGALLTEYNPASASKPAGEIVGPVHLKLGGNLKDLDAVSKKVKEYNDKGVQAYPAYSEGWQVWTGFFADEAYANSQLEAIKKKLGTETITVVKASNTKVVVTDSLDSVLLLYDASKVFLKLHPTDVKNAAAFLKINGTAYRGDIEVKRLSGSDMTVVNVLPMEQYLYGVVPCEIEAASPAEALKAQAVTARTYALNNLGKHENIGFDLSNTTSDQVYKGMSAEYPSSNKAVDDTKGLKVTYKGALAEVFYFSSSGGRTESNENVWGTPLPYLRSVEDKYESGKSWNYNWEAVYTADKIKEVLLGRKIDIGDITGIQITKVSESGRVTELVIKGTKGEKVYTKSSTRGFLSQLASQMYTISTDSDVIVKNSALMAGRSTLAAGKIATGKGIANITSDKSKVTVLGAGNKKKGLTSASTTYTFKGKGWGHGVGMSQEGAKGMAAAGFKFDEILTHYFQGTEIK